MDYLSNRTDPSFKSLIEMGTKGFYPLFDPRWLNEFSTQESNKLNTKEKAKAKRLWQRLSKHKSIERKKTILLSLTDEDRLLFIKAFFQTVEGKILDKNPEIH
ncbi:MAG: hypothetical protein HN509_08080 [Halobacteriovoraceae bacterium]|nr:hypothetical protein [Halobacteriovoraceae bacterium]MBT5093606.1 hypothetical protein [Halobacteriovoraceae bacterium]